MHRSPTRGWAAPSAALVALLSLAVTGTGCGNAAPKEGRDAYRDAYSDAVLGFERAGWTATGATAAASNEHTKGTQSLAVTPLSLPNPPNEIDLVSPGLSSAASALAGIGDDGTSLLVDVQLPTQLGNPHNAGSLQLWISCPSRGLDVYAGKASFKDARLGIFRTVTFAIPSEVSAALREPGWTDLVLHFRLHTPGRDSGTYVFDNVRVRSPLAPPPGAGQSIDLVALRSYDPPSSTPGTATFPPQVVQIPQSFHVKLGSAGQGTVSLELGRSGSASILCTYAASKDGTDYVYSSCTGGYSPGDLVNAGSAVLTIVDGDHSAPTKIRAQLAGSPLGDTLGNDLIPPMPTFWGDTPESASRIATEYFAAATKVAPEAETWVVAPKGEFARRSGDGTPNDNLEGPPPPNDPPFDRESHLNPGGAWDGYWRQAGNLSWDGAQSSTHFESNVSTHAVVWGYDVTVVKLSTTVDTSRPAGGTPTSHGTVSAYVFGAEIPLLPDPGTDFGYTLEYSDRIDAPPIQIWVFYIQIGVKGTLRLSAQGALSGGGFDITVTPHAAVGAHIEGGVSIYAVRGGVAADIDLITIDLPLSAKAGWIFQTDPTVCNAGLDYTLSGDFALGTLGGNVDLVATFGFCPFCTHASWTVFSWDPLPVANKPLFRFNGQSFTALPTSACVVPLQVAITSPAQGSSVSNGISTVLTGTAKRPATPGAQERDVACASWTWTSSNPADAGFPATGTCSPSVTFNGLGSRTVTLTVADQYGETGSVSSTFEVVTCANPTPGYVPGTPCGLGFCGTVQCDGSCSPSTPTNYNQQCQCGGIAGCSGVCNDRSDLGSACGCSGGTIQCDGSCSKPQSPNAGTPCDCGGTYNCDGTCSAQLPTNYRETCSSCGATIQCDGSCGACPRECNSDSDCTRSRPCGPNTYEEAACSPTGHCMYYCPQ
jgi:hypothetical protein